MGDFAEKFEVSTARDNIPRRPWSTIRDCRIGNRILWTSLEGEGRVPEVVRLHSIMGGSTVWRRLGPAKGDPMFEFVRREE